MFSMSSGLSLHVSMHRGGAGRAGSLSGLGFRTSRAGDESEQVETGCEECRGLRAVVEQVVGSRSIVDFQNCCYTAESCDAGKMRHIKCNATKRPGAQASKGHSAIIQQNHVTAKRCTILSVRQAIRFQCDKVSEGPRCCGVLRP